MRRWGRNQNPQSGFWEWFCSLSRLRSLILNFYGIPLIPRDVRCPRATRALPARFPFPRISTAIPSRQRQEREPELLPALGILRSKDSPLREAASSGIRSSHIPGHGAGREFPLPAAGTLLWEWDCLGMGQPGSSPSGAFPSAFLWGSSWAVGDTFQRAPGPIQMFGAAGNSGISDANRDAGMPVGIQGCCWEFWDL